MIIEGVDVLIANEEKIELYAHGKILHTFKTNEFKELSFSQTQNVEYDTKKYEMRVEFNKAIRCETEGVGRIQTNEFSFITPPKLWCGLDKTLDQMDREMSPGYEQRGEY